MPGKTKFFLNLAWLLPYFLFGWSQTVSAAFNIDSISPATISSPDDVVTLSVSASNLSANTQYLQVAMTKVDQTNYFGFTLNNSNQWQKYKSSPQGSDLTDFYSFTPQNGTWTGSVQAKIDPQDSGFSGSGTYNLKLLKYITSSPSSSNVVSLSVNLATSSPSSIPATTSESPKWKIDFAPPTNIAAGSSFDIPIQLSDFLATSYFLKVRIGPDASHLIHGQTDSASWLNDNDAWSKFPTINIDANGSWQGSVKARLPETEQAGDYQLQLRFKKVLTDSYYESDLKTIRFTPGPPPPPPVTKQTTTPAPSTKLALVTAKTPLASLRSSGVSTTSPDRFDVLGTSTVSPQFPLPKITTENSPKLQARFLNQKTSTFPLEQWLIPGGLFMFGFALTFILRSKFARN